VNRFFIVRSLLLGPDSKPKRYSEPGGRQALKWDTAWRALRGAAGLPGFRFHDLRHTVVTDLLEAGEPEHVIEAITGHLSRRMLEHYSHQRLKAKGQMLTRMEERRKKESA
jgi:integrase